MNGTKDDRYNDQEAQRRTETALRAAFGAPHKPQSEMKVGKPRGKPRKSLGKRKAVKKSGSKKQA